MHDIVGSQVGGDPGATEYAGFASLPMFTQTDTLIGTVVPVLGPVADDVGAGRRLKTVVDYTGPKKAIQLSTAYANSHVVVVGRCPGWLPPHKHTAGHTKHVYVGVLCVVFTINKDLLPILYM